MPSIPLLQQQQQQQQQQRQQQQQQRRRRPRGGAQTSRGPRNDRSGSQQARGAQSARTPRRTGRSGNQQANNSSGKTMSVAAAVMVRSNMKTHKRVAMGKLARGKTVDFDPDILNAMSLKQLEGKCNQYLIPTTREPQTPLATTLRARLANKLLTEKLRTADFRMRFSTQRGEEIAGRASDRLFQYEIDLQNETPIELEEVERLKTNLDSKLTAFEDAAKQTEIYADNLVTWHDDYRPVAATRNNESDVEADTALRRNPDWDQMIKEAQGAVNDVGSSFADNFAELVQRRGEIESLTDKLTKAEDLQQDSFQKSEAAKKQYDRLARELAKKKSIRNSFGVSMQNCKP